MTSHRAKLARATAKRRGVAVVLVLGLIAIALSLSYAVMRSQGTALLIQANSSRQEAARQAATSGLAAGLRKMHQTDWAGVDTVLSGRLSATESYSVSYRTGDPQLAPGHPDYANWPYRVTLLSTGYAVDPASGNTSQHQVQAVVRLVPRQLAATPPDWSAMQQYTLYQWADEGCRFEIPCRIEGPVWMQGRISLCPTYPSYDAARTRYLGDLNAMRTAGRPDYRPFNGPISLRLSEQSSSTLSLLTTQLGVSTVSISAAAPRDWTPPRAPASYQLYPGGKVYSVPRVGAVLENVALGPHPETNPLGLFAAVGEVQLRGNVMLQGTLIGADRVEISGTNVRVERVDLPGLDGSSLPVRLQTLTAGRKLKIRATASGSIRGAVAVWKDLEFEDGSEAASFAIEGRVIAEDIMIGSRAEWIYTSQVWANYLLEFYLQFFAGGSNRIDYFPTFMATKGRQPAPRLTIRPAATPAVCHWYTPGQPIYIPHPADGGLRWDLVRWTDRPR